MPESKFSTQSICDDVEYRDVHKNKMQVISSSKTDEAVEDILNSMKRLSTDEKRLQEISKLLV